MRQRLAIIMIGSMLTTPLVLAGTATDALAVCMQDSTTGKDRKDLSRWIITSISTHPEMQSLFSVTQQTRLNADKTMAALVTKLVTESCLSQTQAAIEQEGASALVTAFGALGRVAMQELMSNSAVNKATSEFAKYMDEKKINARLYEK
ncbi:hypothetical protein HZU77_001330 [Neisseriaceae bacterium TC5R-5]|nr:hypothetical protein [Neisseriaceae bacterium TC5R-5]